MVHRPWLAHFMWVLAGVFLCVSCWSGDSGDTEDRAKDRQQDDGPVIALTEETEFWPAAIVAGRLTERHGCLLIGDSVAVFPAGTAWDAPLVTFSGGDSVEVNSRVRLAGGGFDIDELTQGGSPIVPATEVHECARRTGATQYVWASPRS